MTRVAVVALSVLALCACATQSSAKKSADGQKPAEPAATQAPAPPETAAAKPADPKAERAAKDAAKKAAKQAAKQQAKASKEAATKAKTASAPEAAVDNGDAEISPTVDTKNPSPSVTLDEQERTMGTAVDVLARKVGGSLVVMSGLEARPVGDLVYKNADFGVVARHLADVVGCQCKEYPNYRFIYPAGYEPLLDLSLAGVLDPAMGARTAAASFSAGVPLHKVIALLGASVGTTLVADNVVGNATIGSVMLSEMPLQEVLEALMRSARMTPGAFGVEASAEYVFIRAAGNPPTRSTLLNGDALTPEQQAILDKQVSVVFPASSADPARPDVSLPPQPLGKLLDTLSQQLGVPVALSDRALADIPINPCAMPKVRVRTAMDLLIRQWPDPAFGYAFKDGKLVIQRIIK